MTDDNDQFIQTFIDESKEHLNELESNLIALEDDPSDEEAINQLFRSAHTIKGNAGAMGFTNASNLAHEMENILDAIREGDLDPSSEIIDALFDGTDALRAIVNEVDGGDDPSTDPQTEIDALRSILGDSTGESADEIESDSASESSQCAALTKSGDRCSREAGQDARYCSQHLRIIEEDGADAVTDYDAGGEDDADETDDSHLSTVLDRVEPPTEPVPHAYFAELEITDSDAAEMVLEAITDAFTVLTTTPSITELREGEYDGMFSAIVVGAIDDGEEITHWFTDMDGVKNVEATDVTDRVEWADPSIIEEGDYDSDDGVEIEDLEDIDSLVGTSDFDEVDEVDEDEVADVDLGMDEMDSAGTFDAADAEDTVIEDDEEEEELPDNKGARIFAELDDEVEQTDNFAEIEQEMEEMEFDEINTDDEVEFDELLEAGPDEFEFDESEGGSADSSGTGFDRSTSEAPGFFDDSDTAESAEEEPDTADEPGDADEVPSPEPEPEPVEAEVDTDIDLDDEATADDTGIIDEGDASAAPSDDPFEESDQPADADTAQSSQQTAEAADEDTRADIDAADETDDGDDSGPLTGFDDMEDDDMFGSAFDEPGGADFDDLLEEAGREVEGSGESIDSIRVDVDQLDELYSLVQELVTSRIRLRRALEEGEGGELAQAFDELDGLETISTRMQDTVMDIRLVRLGRITDRLPRVVRDAARDTGKEANLTVEGEDVELDRAILEQLGDPLMHLVRNAVDHGIEHPDVREQHGKDPEGNVTVRARRTRDRVTILIEDDGEGIDADSVRQKAVDDGILTEQQVAEISDDQALDLIFHPGFSTAEEVSETSGRGVGLDVVYTTIRSLDGTVDVSSTPGEGTTFRLRLPVSLAIDEVLLVESGGEEFGIPIKNISEITDVENIEHVSGQEAHLHNEEVYPVVRLHDAFDTPDLNSDATERLIRIDSSVRQIAIHCDDVVESKEVVVDPYDGVLRTIPGVSGAAVLGEGDVVNIVDVEGL